MNLNNLIPGEEGNVTAFHANGALKRRLLEMGITTGVNLKVVKVAPLGDPIEVKVRGYELSLRKKEAEQIEIKKSNIMQLNSIFNDE